ncbi:uncharacterized protein K452DRAFT_226106 [Aplosporella prunicola CBS 121167]|uniref:THO complex subunit 2 n=1 Tax=Aplosporella prunicola CBS 121167 TaxID=1176127 RepID=A0A6A6BIB1_9PEZI|nr:uncharacterized protein K452DRAFT_226106 [Aplosporella prunicola CBS 121167]KAF2142994.1 hypothetical protein K452DRAFT_226106 [Aplosporella prunicola CBS 121167]
MVPPVKRKRNDRPYQQDPNDNSRPSPHRPHNLNLAQQTQYNNGAGRGRGGRRDSRGGGRSGQMASPASAHSPSASRASPNIPKPADPPSPSPSPAATRPPSAQNAPAPAPAQSERPHAQHAPAPPAPKPSRPFHYQYVTDENKAAWRTTGRKAVVEFATKAQEAGDIMALSIVFQELLRAGLDSRIEVSDAGQVVKEVLAAAGDGASESASLFLDNVSILSEADGANPALRTVMIAAEIPAAQIREELEVPLLTNLGFVRSTFFKMGTRHATNQLYRQSNYNLLREETEGYSKLMTEYFTTTNSGPPTGELAEDTFQRVKALIGAFDLDVGRVLDVTLDVFANLLVKHYRFFIKFLRVSSWWPEEKGFEGLEWESLGLDSLPPWALPDSPAWMSSEEDKERLTVAREARDRKFWDRVREVGYEAFFELGGRRIIKGDVKLPDAESQEAITDAAKAKKAAERTEQEFNREWMATTKTLPPPGNRVAAQLLGFKLRFYASSARDVNDTLPENLIALAALLIKIGFISLRDLYPHLYPLDENMGEVKEKLEKERIEREKKNRPGGGALNALAAAGALADDTVPMSAPSRLREAEASRSSSAKPEEKGTTPKAEEGEKEKLPEPADQKIALLKSLLTIGAIPESLYILGKFPWLMDLQPDLPTYLHRILKQCLSKVYDRLQPLADRESIRVAKKIVSDQPGAVKREVNLVEAPPRRLLRWAQLDKSDAGENNTDYKFYWEDWDDNVPVCQTVDDVFLMCSTLLNHSGVKIGQDPTLLIKLARIGKWSWTDDESEENHARWIDLCKRLLVPALSLTKANPGVVNEVYDLLKLFPTATRYIIYAEWYTGQISRLPDIKSAFDQARAETKDVLKRISKTNTKQMARALAKVAFSSPGIVFSVALNQIESYENLVEVVVECARYFTYLGYDVLTWTLMSSLGGRGRGMTQADGMLTSPWLRALSLFAGRVFKRYTFLNATPILQYVAHQLRTGNSTALEVLEQIVTSMAGIRSDMNFNEWQTLAMAGGEHLRTRMLEQIQDKRHESKTSSKRLMKALSEGNLTAQLLIAIAQERRLYPHSEDAQNAPLKVLGTNLDKLHEVFFQYLDVLRTNLSVKDFDAAVPDVASLMSEFGLEPQIAFAVVRPSISHAVAEVDAAVKEAAAKEAAAKTAEQDKPKEDKPTASDDVEMADASANGASEANGPVVESTEAESSENKDTPGREEDDTTKEPGAGADATPGGDSTPSPASTAPWDWHPVIKELMEKIRPTLPSDFEANMSLPFYTTFWQLALQDLHVPSQCYIEESKRLTDKGKAMMHDRSDVSAQGKAKKDAKQKELNDLSEALTKEYQHQIAANTVVRNRLRDEKNHWFAQHPLAGTAALHDTLVQECFLPRILTSPLDAHYAYKMLLWLHSQGTPGFRTMYLIDRIMKEKQLTSLIFMCTAREAENLGRFLNELLKELRRWHAESSVYEKLAYGTKKDLPGFARKFKPDSDYTPETFLTYEDFRRLLYKWHAQLNGALKACFTGGEYMHIRNAINILKFVHQNFPVVNWMGKAQLECVQNLSKTETREDLKLAGTSLIGDLKKRESQWLLPQAFRLADPNATQPKPGSRAATEGPNGTPTPVSSQAKQLNASAPEFQPSGTATVNISTTGGMDAEDGEIDDSDTHRNRLTVSVAAGEEDQTRSGDATKSSSASETKASTPIPGAPTSLPSRGGPDSKPPTPAPQNTFHRPEPNRNQSMGSRAPHALPNRPEPLGRGRMSDRTMDRPPRHDNRGPPEYGRLDRPGDIPRDDFNDRRDQPPNRRDRGRSPAGAERPSRDIDRRETQWQGGREAWEHPDERGRPLPRDTRQGGRPPQWEGPRGQPTFDPLVDRGRGRPFDSPNQIPTGEGRYQNSMPPPTTGPYQHAERSSRPPLAVNPERAALIEGDMRRPNSENFRTERDNRRDRGSRPHSPRREERPSDFPPRGDYRDERGPPERPPLNYPPSGSGRDRRDDPNSIPPTGPRSDRPGRNDYASGPSGGRGRELFEPGPLRAPPTDPNHGRLNQDFLPSRPQDPGYGRLNGPGDVPSGPRGRGASRQGGRGFLSGPGDSGQRGSVPQSPLSDRGAPTGPNAERREYREPQSFDYGPQSSANDQGPDTSTVHPSRLSHISGSRDMPAPSTAASSFPPPSGPRGSRQSGGGATAPSPGRNPPTGPASSDRRQEPDKRFAGIQNMLQQGGSPSPYERSGERGASIRGRAARGGPSSTASPAASAPGTPIPSHFDASSRGGDRPDLMADEQRGSRRERRGDGERRRHRSSSRDRDNREGGSGRERPPRTDEGREPREPREAREPREPRESRDKRSGPGDREGREPRESGRRSNRDDREREPHGHGSNSGGHHREGGRRGGNGPRDPMAGGDDFSMPMPPPHGQNQPGGGGGSSSRRGGNSNMMDEYGGGGGGAQGQMNGEQHGGGGMMMRGSGGRDRREGGGGSGREPREPREQRESRDGRKRGRTGDVDGGQHGENKRPRRGGGERSGREHQGT